MISLLASLLSLALLLTRALLSLAAPALVLLLFAEPPSEVRAFLSHAPIALLVLMLLMFVLLDFCSDLWRIWKVNRYESRSFAAIVFGLRSPFGSPIAESLLRLSRSSRWRLLFSRDEWFFVVLWLLAAAWVNLVASLPLIFGISFCTLLLLSGAMFLRLEGESRERGIADSGLRFAASLVQARRLGRLSALVRRGIKRHQLSRSYEHRLAIASAVILLLVRICSAATFVVTLLYGLTLVGRNEARVGEIVALVLLLRSLSTFLEQQARHLALYAPRPKIDYRAAQNMNLGLAGSSAGSSAGSLDKGKEGVPVPAVPVQSQLQKSESASVKVLESLQGLLHFPSSGKDKHLSLEGLELSRGEVVALTGASGSGKSLFLRACAGLYASKGLSFLGKDVAGDDSEHLAKLIGYVPQEVSLLEGTIAENITSFQAASGDVSAEFLASILTGLAADKFLAKLPDGLGTFVEPFAEGLPYGFKVQILIAAALYNKPRLLLLDASVSGLDEGSLLSLTRVIASLKQRGVSTIVVTPQPILLQICDSRWHCDEDKVRPIGLAQS